MGDLTYGPPGLPPGSLLRVADGGVSSLGGASTGDLAKELLQRIRGGEPLDSLGIPLEELAMLGMELELGTEQPACRFSIARLAATYVMMREFPGAEQPPIEGANYVELGCGSINPLGSLMLFVLLGLREGVGVDLDPPQDVRSAVRGVGLAARFLLTAPERVLGARDFARFSADAVYANLKGFDYPRLWQGDERGMDKRRLRYLQAPAQRTGLPDGYADLVCSQSFLEHVDVDAVLAEMARITRPGGFGVHSIDSVDHRVYGVPELHPLEFLRVATDEPLVFGCNRLRPTEFIGRFEDAGFDVVGFDPHQRIEIDPELRSGLAEPFRSMDDDTLAITQGLVRVRRR